MDLKKELSIPDILATAWEIFREHFQQIALIILMVYIPIEILHYYLPTPETTTVVSDGELWQQALQEF